MDEENKIELFDPATIVFFVAAFLIDLSFLGLFGLLIPGVGLAIAMFVLLAHWSFGLVLLFYFWGKTNGLVPKAILIIFWIVPLPLTLGLILMVVTSNPVGAFVFEQVAIQAVAVATAGAGEALEAGAAVAEGAEAAATVAEGAEAAGTAAEGAEAVGGVAEVGEATAGAGTEAGQAVEGMDLTPEERNPMENLREDLAQPQEDRFHEEPANEEPEPDKSEEDLSDKKENKTTRTMRDIIDRANDLQNRNEQDDEEDEGLEEAA